MPGHTACTVSASLWQIPHAPTLMRTNPSSASGRAISRNSTWPASAAGTNAARIVVEFIVSLRAALEHDRARKGDGTGMAAMGDGESRHAMAAVVFRRAAALHNPRAGRA